MEQQVSKISLDQGQRVLALQPFSVLLGATLTELSAGQAEITVPIRRELLQQHGFVHGGVISYIADNALTYAGGTMYGDALTAEYKVNYVRPAQGETLIARAQVIHAGKRQAVCRCDVYVVRDGSETMCATAVGTISNFSAESRA